MQLIHRPADLQPGGRKVSVGIGMFDGVHLGHQQVLKQTISDARQHNGLSLAITFDRHPATILNPAKAPRLVYSLPQKLREIQALGIDAILLIPFTAEFSQIPGEQFIRDLVRDLGQVYSICVGSTFTFGHKRSGNVDLLKQLGSELRFLVHGLSAVSLEGQVVSSTRIRERITAGDLDAASQMLGRTYSISGKVTHGDKLGSQLGTPTANIDITGLLTPPNGVYAVQAKLGKTLHPAVANLGFRPTVSNANPSLRFEVHLLNFTGDLYEQELEIVFSEFIRGEQRFDSLDALKAQITRDKESARRILV
ncbi:MAG TPA: bifunctional riboflavin kinase/FAD synthetase [Verrucomicrobiae bacterium]